MKIILALSVFLVSCASLNRQSETARFDRYVDDVFEKNLQLYPQHLTSLGRKDRYGELNDQSEAFEQQTFERRKLELAELAQFNRDKLEPQAQLTFDLYKKNLEDFLAEFQWRDYGYAVTQHGGIHTHLPAFMMTKHRVDNEADLRAYISRLNGFKKAFADTVEGIKRSEAAGVVPPKFVYSDIQKASRNVITGRPFAKKGKDSPLYADFKTKLEKLKLPADKARELTGLAEAALTHSVKPAYEGLMTEIRRLEKVATTDDGVWKFPRGDEYYRARLKRMTTTDLTPDEIHELGLKNVERLRAEMVAVQQKLGFKGSLPAFFNKMRNDPKQYFPNSEAGRAAYLELANSYRDFMVAKIPEYFRLIPKTPFEIRAVEKFREQAAGKAFYDRPSDDGKRPGVYYVNLSEMKDVPKFEAEPLFYHEGIPGHHFQIALQIELKNLPKIRRLGLFYTAFTEGWGLYTERLAKEMGAYQDPYSELGRLSMEMLRAGRLVVDTGIHHKKWTRAQALKFFGENLPVSEGSQSEQIERYIVMPGQATAYMVGMLKILDLRENARTALGDKFDIRDFHDVVLQNGAVPLDTLTAHVDAYIAAKKK